MLLLSLAVAVEGVEDVLRKLGVSRRVEVSRDSRGVESASSWSLLVVERSAKVEVVGHDGKLTLRVEWAGSGRVG